MIATLPILAVVVVMVVGIPALAILLGAYRRSRGKRIITCPETEQPAAVDLKAWHAAVTTLRNGEPNFQLKSCSRWPERQDCGQQCLRQIETAPEDCLVRTILARWYQGKVCVYCGKPVDQIQWAQHRPTLMSPERKTYELSEVRPEDLPGALSNHLPVCWNCHIAETFRREHPELVVERPWKS